tara:strand:- start:13027 stop:14304 length:1278 start_codon:yes stop_codon:yes gene_type:complete
MTIDAGWNKIIKSGVPDAFTKTLPASQTPKTVFVDGQIKLMCSCSIQQWKTFFNVQFVSTIDKAFNTGAETVIIGFDDYSHVPAAKNMTQIKRCRNVPAMNFSPDDALPTIMPENWSAAMRNRTFKVKVIQLIINNIRLHYGKDDSMKRNNQTIIVDFIGDPILIGTPRDLPDLAGKRGECDIKAFAWLCYGPLLIISTDGDFVAISLVQLERLILQTQSKHNIYLLRMKTNVDPPGKQQRDKTTKREYEYVDMLRVLSWLNGQMQKSGFSGSPAKNFAAMVACTGCDFAMNLPNIGPKKLWEARNSFCRMDVTSPEGLLLALSRVYYHMYEKKLAPVPAILIDKHSLESSAGIYQQVSSDIKASTKISERVQDRTWNLPRMKAHVQNAHWTLQYWSDLQHFPDPLSGQFGFERKGKHVTFGGDV